MSSQTPQYPPRSEAAPPQRTGASRHATLPGWLDRAMYPFRPRTFDTGEGRIAYLDEGDGPTVVLVHGTPTWSFLYRRLVPPLVAAGYRVIAPDHLGFGLSEKPDGAGYRPADHARRVTALLDALDVRDLTLVVHDFGGPVGLSHAVERQERVSRIVVLNSWLWPLDDDARIARGARLAAGPVGRLLYTRLNASPRWLLPAAFAERARLDPSVHRHYLAPFPDAPSRRPLWEMARALLGSSAWYDGLWRRRDQLRAMPALLVWGMHDPTFGSAHLARWREALPDARIVKLAGVGHFVQEEAAPGLEAHLLDFLRESPG